MSFGFRVLGSRDVRGMGTKGFLRLEVGLSTYALEANYVLRLMIQILQYTMVPIV